MRVNKLITIFFVFIVFPMLGLSQTADTNDIVKPTNTKDNSFALEFQPVIFNEDTLFYVADTLAFHSSAKKAKEISEKIIEISNSYSPIIDSIYYQINEDDVLVMYRDNLVFSISDLDVFNTSLTKKQFAKDCVISIKAALKDDIYNLSKKEWLLRILYSVLALVGLFVFFFVVKYSFRILNNRLSKIDRKLLKKRNNLFKYFIPKKTKNIFVFISNATKSIIIIFFLFVYLPFLFSFLPWTQGLSELFYIYISQPVKFVFQGLVNFLPHLFFIIIIVIIARYIVRIIREIAEDIDAEELVLKGFPKDWAIPTQKLFAVIVYAFALVMVFPHLPGSDSPAFKGVSIFLGVLFSLGSTSAVANAVAGIVITYMRPFQIGDRINIAGTVGDVIEKTILVTRLQTPKNEEITIPNATIINEHLINYSANADKEGLILNTKISLGYDVPQAVAEKLLLRAVKQSMLIQRTPKPFVLQTSLDDYYVTYELNAYTKQAKKMPLIYSDIHKNIIEIFDQEGVEILSPKYVASREGNSSTVPSQKGKDLRNPVEKAIDHLKGTKPVTKKKIKIEEKDKKTTKDKKNTEDKK